MKSALLLILIATLVASAGAGDLYRVEVGSSADAEQLQVCGVEPLIRLNDGYLVLAEGDSRARLSSSALKIEYIAGDIEKSGLALDMRPDEANIDRFPLLFQDGNLRVFAVDLSDPSISAMPSELMPIRNEYLQITYLAPIIPRARGAMGDMVDLDSLLNLVVQDSLQSYTEALQAFPTRVYGTQGNYDARDWIEAKFRSFGYDDSTYIDPFTYYAVNCYNVVATKVGTRFPDHQIIITSHFDDVAGSPGADDNGSGTAGVLELARVLKDIETDMTIIFACFDTEEAGLVGSWHYAEDAFARGDNIVHAFNMDMIGFYNNNAQVTVYHGPDVTYSTLYNQLADSLLGLTGYLSGNSGGSDHYPFTQMGYSATFIIEYNFSTVYHSPQDSTTYMSFPYHTKLARSGLAVTYYISQTEGPLPSLAFSYPGGLPEYILPGQTTAFEVVVDGLFDGVPVPGSGQLHYNIAGGGWMSEALAEAGGNLYEATLPSASCLQIIDYYVSMEEATEGVFNDPDADEPRNVIVATEQIIPIHDNFETDLGWIASAEGATSGFWERGVPVDDDGWDYDPISDADGSGSCYLTQNEAGNSDVDNGTVRLKSPAFDMTLGGSISYEYYFYTNQSPGDPDRLLVEINDNDGMGEWHEIAMHNTSGGLAWRHHEISQNEITALGLSLTSMMRMRFSANDDYPQSILEAGLDNFRVVSYDCVNPWLCGDADNDGIGPNIADLVYLVMYMFQDGPPPDEMGSVDVNGNGIGPDIEDLVYLVMYMFQDGPDLICP